MSKAFRTKTSSLSTCKGIKNETLVLRWVPPWYLKKEQKLDGIKFRLMTTLIYSHLSICTLRSLVFITRISSKSSYAEVKYLKSLEFKIIHKIENALIRCFRADGVETSLKSIVKYLQQKNKNRDYEYIIKDKVNNRTTKVLPRMIRP